MTGFLSSATIALTRLVPGKGGACHARLEWSRGSGQGAYVVRPRDEYPLQVLQLLHARRHRPIWISVHRQRLVPPRLPLQ